MSWKTQWMDQEGKQVDRYKQQLDCFEGKVLKMQQVWYHMQGQLLGKLAQNKARMEAGWISLDHGNQPGDKYVENPEQSCGRVLESWDICIFARHKPYLELWEKHYAPESKGVC